MVAKVICVVVGVLGLVCGSFAALADSSASLSPQEVFRSKGLTIAGTYLVTGDEQSMHDVARSARGLKAKVASETLARANMNRAIDTSSATLDQIYAKIGAINEELKKLENDADRYNQLVAPHNELVKEAREREATLAGLQRRLGNIDDSQQSYSDAATAATKQADLAKANYAELAGDRQLKAAIDSYNSTAAEAIKLGPSGTFVSDVSFIKKCADDMVSNGIAIHMEQNIPIVEVVINGKKTSMLWDSGASVVSLSAKTAEALGITVGEDDPTAEFTVADGRKVKARETIIPAIQLGPYTVENVECMLLPAEVSDAPDLLGGSFQNHFLFKLDAAAGVLHLTPNDKSAYIGTPKGTAAGKDRDGGIASPFADRPRDLMGSMKGQYSSFVDGIFEIKEGDRIFSPQQFKPPVAFRIIAKTDSTNLRLRYAADQIIFNWEVNGDQLRIDGGPADGRHKNGAGNIPTDTWVTVDLVVMPDAMSISVDGKERYHTEADFTKIDQRLEIFQGGDAVIQVKAVQAGKPR